MIRPKVSIIIPVYGVEKYIERCARSLFEQSLDDIVEDAEITFALIDSDEKYSKLYDNPSRNKTIVLVVEEPLDTRL